MTLRGKKLTEEHKAKISKSHIGKIGHPNTEEQKKASSIRWSGNGNPKWVTDREALASKQKMRGICHGLVRRCVDDLGRVKVGKT